MRVASWVNAADRFMPWERKRLALDLTTVPTFSSNNERSAALSTWESATRNEATTRVKDRLAC
jgi:hypothetical protein